MVTQTRPKQYPFRREANRFYRPDSNGKIKEHHSDDPGGNGWEIDREVFACPACLQQHEGGGKSAHTKQKTRHRSRRFHARRKEKRTRSRRVTV